MKWSAILLAHGVFTLCLSASAQEGELTVYGTVLPYVENFRTDGATAEGLSPDTGGATQVSLDDYTGDNLPERFRLTSGTSNIGFRGSLKLSKYFNAFFQIENAVGPDGDPYILASAWASRNSAVGVKSSTFGTLFFGNWDTPYKHPTLFVGPIRGLNPFDNAITGNPGFNVPVTTTQNGRDSARHDAAFKRRQGNSIQYWTPSFVGLSARLAASLNEGRTLEEYGPSINPILWSALVSFEHGPFAVHYGYEQHLDYFGADWVGGSPGATFTNPSSTDDGHEVVAWYEFPTRTRLAVVLERLTYRTDDEVVGAVNGYQREAVYGALRQHLGDHAVWGAFGMANAGRCTTVGDLPCTTNGLNGMQWSVGYTYSPVKTFDIYASYAQVSNGRSATYGEFPPVVPVAPGVTTHSFGVGFLFTFEATVALGGAKKPEEKPAATREPEESAPAPEPEAPKAPEPPVADEPEQDAAPAAPVEPAEPPSAQEPEAAPAPPAP